MPSSYGMHVTAVARRPADFDAVADSLIERGGHLHSLTRYHAAMSRHEGVVFGYGVADAAEIGRGVALLRASLVSRTA